MKTDNKHPRPSQMRTTAENRAMAWRVASLALAYSTRSRKPASACGYGLDNRETSLQCHAKFWGQELEESAYRRLLLGELKNKTL